MLIVNIAPLLLEELQATSEQETALDFSSALFALFDTLLCSPQRGVWEGVLPNICIALDGDPQGLNSDGVILMIGVEKMQEFMALPPAQFTTQMQDIFKEMAQYCLGAVSSTAFTPTTFAPMENLWSHAISDQIRQHHAHCAGQNAWGDAVVAPSPTPANDLMTLLGNAGKDQDIRKLAEECINAFADVAQVAELSSRYNLRCLMRQISTTLIQLAPEDMVNVEGTKRLSRDFTKEITDKMVNHPSISVMTKSDLRTELASPALFNPTKVLEQAHQRYAEVWEIKTKLCLDDQDFWEAVRQRVSARTSPDAKDALVKTIVENYKFPVKALTDTHITALRFSPYVLQRLFDSNLLTTTLGARSNFVDPHEKKYMVNCRLMSLKDLVENTLPDSYGNDFGEEEKQAKNSLLSMFQRMTLVNSLDDLPSPSPSIRRL